LTRRLLVMLGLVTLSVLAVLWLARRGSDSTETVRSALSPQGCVTSCQTQQTDCILKCDGVVPCEKRCVVAGRRCARGCRGTPDAGKH
jgi:hypothetical protein